MPTVYLNPEATVNGSGTEANPYNAWLSAMAGAGAGGTVYVTGGTLSAPLSGIPSGPSSGAKTKIIGDPANRFVVSGGVSIGAMAPCVSGDATYVGDSWASMYKITVSKSLFPGGNPFNANLCEGGTQLPLCIERAGDPADPDDNFFLTYPGSYHQATSLQTSGGNIVSYTLTSVTNNYTATQIENSRIQFVYGSNRAGDAPVTLNGSDQLVVSGTYADAGASNLYQKHFALLNLLPAMEQGQHGFRDLGNGSVVMYVWPNSTASIAALRIKYASAAVGFDLGGRSNIEISDFVVEQIASPLTSDAPIVSRNTGTHASHVHLHDFEVRNCTALSGYGAFYFNGVDDLHIHDFLIDRMQGGFGIFCQGNNASNADWPRLRMTANVSLSAGTVISGSGNTATVRFTEGSFIYLGKADSGKSFPNGSTVTASGYSGTVQSNADMSRKGDASLVRQMLRTHIHDFEIRYVSSAPIRVFTCRDMAVYRGFIHKAAKQSHGNTINFYQGSHNCLVWGLNGEGTDGYYTWQESDSLVFAFCAASASNAPNGGARAIYAQQNRYSEHPGNVHGWKGSYCLNTRGIPVPSRATSSTLGNGLDLSSFYAIDDLWTAWNNIHHGSSSEGGGAPLAAWDYNLNTKGSSTGSALRGPNDVSADWSATYVDAEAGDFRYKTGAIARTFTGRNWSSLIPGFKARWPFVPESVFDLDLAGDEINWTNLRAGPAGNMNWIIATNGGESPVGGGGGEPPPPPDPVITQINAGSVTIELVSPS